MSATTLSTSTASGLATASIGSITRLLLALGALAGPIYLAVYFIQAFTREGFDVMRHPASVLSNGDLGWIQVTSFVVNGLLLVAGAVGMRRTLHPGRAGTWGPILLALSGLGMLGGAVFTADPMDGFPPGTPLGPPTSMTTFGTLHFVAGMVGFISWIAMCFVVARRFRAEGERGWATFSTVTGILFPIGFISSGFIGSVVGFVGAVVLMFVYITMLLMHLRQR